MMLTLVENSCSASVQSVFTRNALMTMSAQISVSYAPYVTVMFLTCVTVNKLYF